MSEENLNLARRGYAAWNQQDFEWIADRINVGKPGWRKFVDVWVGAWKTIAVKVERIEDLGNDVLALVTFEGVGRGSGAVASLTFAHRIGFREGRFADIRVLPVDEALKAAGLDP